MDEEFLKESLEAEQKWLGRFRQSQGSMFQRKDTSASSKYSFSTEYNSGEYSKKIAYARRLLFERINELKILNFRARRFLFRAGGGLRAIVKVAGGSDSGGREPGIGCERSGGRTIRRFASETRSERVVRRCTGPGGRAAAVHRCKRRKSAAQAGLSREEPQLGTRSAEKSKTTISKEQVGLNVLRLCKRDD